MLKIAYVWDSLLPTTRTEAEQAINTVAALSRRGHQLTVYVPSPSSQGHVKAQQLLDQYRVAGDFGLKYVPTPLVRRMLARKYFFAKRLASISELADYDCVYTRNIGVFLASCAAGFPAALDTYLAWPKQFPPLRRAISRAMGRDNFMGAFFHSDYARASYMELGVAQSKLHTMRNGFEPSRYANVPSQSALRADLGLPESQLIATYTGHVNMSKGAGLLMAMAKLCPHIVFCLVGGEETGLTKRLAARHANIRFVPWQPPDQVVKYQLASDVLLIPPTSAPLRLAGHTILPMKVYGYLAAAKPIVAPSTPDLLEVLRDGDNAVLVAPDEPAAAAKALRELVDDEPLRARLSARAKETSRGLSWDARAAGLEACLAAANKA